MEHKILVLHAVLLVRTVQRYLSKEEQRKLMNMLSDTELIDFIDHFDDYRDETEWYHEDDEPNDYGDDQHYIRSASAGDYGPGNPWDAPGMCISDFI